MKKLLFIAVLCTAFSLMASAQMNISDDLTLKQVEGFIYIYNKSKNNSYDVTFKVSMPLKVDESLPSNFVGTATIHVNARNEYVEDNDGSDAEGSLWIRDIKGDPDMLSTQLCDIYNCDNVEIYDVEVN